MRDFQSHLSCPENQNPLNEGYLPKIMKENLPTVVSDIQAILFILGMSSIQSFGLMEVGPTLEISY